MNQILCDTLILLLLALLGYLISFLLRTEFDKDYSLYLTMGITLLVATTPLIIILFFKSNFNLPFYVWESKWAPLFLVGCIVDVVFRPVFVKIFEPV